MPGNFVYAPAQSEMNQIESADKAYMSQRAAAVVAAVVAADPRAAAAEETRQ